MFLLSKSDRTQRIVAVLLAALLALFAAACGSSNSGFPKQPGQYTIQPSSLSFDGKKYSMLWAEEGGAVHLAEGEDVRMQQDERTVLEIGNGSPIVHLKEDEAVIVKGRDRDGAFQSSWFPFLLGTALGSGLGGGRGPVVINQPYPGDSASRGPSYQYPPTDTFGRGDDLHGSVQRSKPQTPDYTKVQPAPYAVSGQSSGTGGGTAATNKSTSPLSGEAGGTGAGSAASNKGTFSSSGSTSGGGTGVNGGSGLSSGSKPSTGIGGGSGSGSSSGSGGISRPSSPPVRAPSGRR